MSAPGSGPGLPLPPTGTVTAATAGGSLALALLTDAAVLVKLPDRLAGLQRALVLSGTVTAQRDGVATVRTAAGEVQIRTPVPLPTDRPVTLQVPASTGPAPAPVTILVPPVATPPSPIATPIPAAPTAPLPPPTVPAGPVLAPGVAVPAVIIAPPSARPALPLPTAPTPPVAGAPTPGVPPALPSTPAATLPAAPTAGVPTIPPGATAAPATPAIMPAPSTPGAPAPVPPAAIAPPAIAAPAAPVTTPLTLPAPAPAQGQNEEAPPPQGESRPAASPPAGPTPIPAAPRRALPAGNTGLLTLTAFDEPSPPGGLSASRPAASAPIATPTPAVPSRGSPVIPVPPPVPGPTPPPSAATPTPPAPTLTGSAPAAAPAANPAPLPITGQSSQVPSPPVAAAAGTPAAPVTAPPALNLPAAPPAMALPQPVRVPPQQAPVGVPPATAPSGPVAAFPAPPTPAAPPAGLGTPRPAAPAAPISPAPTPSMAPEAASPVATTPPPAAKTSGPPPAPLASLPTTATTTGPATTPAIAPRAASPATAATEMSAPPLPRGEPLQVRIIALEPPPDGTIAAPAQQRATLVGNTSLGQPILTTPAGTLVLAGRSDLPPGTGLTVALEPPAAAAAGMLPPLDPVHGADWPALREMMQLVAATDPALARSLTQQMLPQPNKRLTTNMIFFLAALRGGDLGGWLAPEATSLLERQGKGALLARLREDFQAASQQAAEPLPDGWRSLPIPFATPEGIGRLQLHLRRAGDGEDGGAAAGGEARAQRFLLDLSFSRIGPMQLDGLVRPGRLDLVIRTHTLLQAEIRQGIGDLFRDSLDLAGYAGTIGFQTGAHRWAKVRSARGGIGHQA